MHLFNSQFDEVGLFGPFEAVSFQPLDEQPEAIAIPEQNLDPVAPAVAEHIRDLSKWIETQPLFNQQGKSVDALPAIDGLPVQEDLQLGIKSEHGRVESKRSIGAS